MNIYFAWMWLYNELLFFFCFHKSKQCLLVFPKYNRNFAANWLLVIFAVSLLLLFLSICFIYAYCSFFIVSCCLNVQKDHFCRSIKKEKKTHPRQEEQEKKSLKEDLFECRFFVNKLIKKKESPFESNYVMYRGVSLNFRLSHHRHHHHKYLLI
jgi:predicted membrane protein